MIEKKPLDTARRATTGSRDQVDPRIATGKTTPNAPEVGGSISGSPNPSNVEHFKIVRIHRTPHDRNSNDAGIGAESGDPDSATNLID